MPTTSLRSRRARRPPAKSCAHSYLRDAVHIPCCVRGFLETEGGIARVARGGGQRGRRRACRGRGGLLWVCRRCPQGGEQGRGHVAAAAPHRTGAETGEEGTRRVPVLSAWAEAGHRSVRRSRYGRGHTPAAYRLYVEVGTSDGASRRAGEGASAATAVASARGAAERATEGTYETARRAGRSSVTDGGRLDVVPDLARGDSQTRAVVRHSGRGETRTGAYGAQLRAATPAAERSPAD